LNKPIVRKKHIVINAKGRNENKIEKLKIKYVEK